MLDGDDSVQPTSNFVIELDLHELRLTDRYEVIQYPVGCVFLDDAYISV